MTLLKGHATMLLSFIPKGLVSQEEILDEISVIDVYKRQSLYRETGDIYLVADVLGHKDVNTTRKHYAAIDDDRRRSAAKYVKLREP